MNHGSDPWTQDTDLQLLVFCFPNIEPQLSVEDVLWHSLKVDAKLAQHIYSSRHANFMFE